MSARSPLLCLMLILGMLGSDRAASAADLDASPMLWTWREPLGAAAGHPNIQALIRIPIGNGSTVQNATDAANRACDEIISNGITAGRVGILLQNLGNDRSGFDLELWRHPDDAVNGEPNIWHAHGIAANRAFMDEFIAVYLARQNENPAIPDPDRFHFDIEFPVSSREPGAPATFAAMMSDSRWTSEPIAGFNGATLADLYAAAGEPTFDPAQEYYEVVNRDWAAWLGGIGYHAADHALAAAAYTPIRAAWPACKSSNWWTSAGFDGAGTPQRVYEYKGPYWFRIDWRAAGRVAAPVLYWVRQSDELPGESAEDAALRLAELKLDAVQHSWTDGTPRTALAPWIERVGNFRMGRAVTPTMNHTMLQSIVDRGIEEALIWSDRAGSNDDESHWNEFAAIVNAVLGIEPPDEAEPSDVDTTELDVLAQEPRRVRIDPAPPSFESGDAEPPATITIKPRPRRAAPIIGSRAAPRLVHVDPRRNVPAPRRRAPRTSPPPPAPRLDVPPPPDVTPKENQPGAPPPIFWTWQEPLGDAAGLSNVIQMVIVKSDLEPEIAAERAVKAIRDRGLRHGEVAIVLQNFGMGGGDVSRRATTAPALHRHPCDGLPHRDAKRPMSSCEPLAERNAAERWSETVWMRHGIAEAQAWIDRFIDVYRDEQARDSALPDPARFHFDTESRVVPYRKGMTEVFAAMQDDPRFDAEPVPGFGGATLAALWAEAGAPTCDPQRPFHHQPNRAWCAWYAGICHQAFEAAMDDAAYARIRLAWPTARCSNYAGSDQYDAAHPRRVPRHAWLEFGYRARAISRAPVCYWARPMTNAPVEDLVEATTASARERFIANQRAWDGLTNDATIVPWLEMIGNVRRVDHRTLTVPAELTFSVLREGRQHGVHEFILWSDDSTQRSTRSWDELVGVISHLWSAVPSAAAITTGAPESGSGDARFADHAALAVRSARTPDQREAVTASVIWTKRLRRFSDGDDLLIAVDATASRPGVTAQLSVRDHRSGSLIPVLQRDLPADGRLRATVPANNDWLTEDGRYELVVELSHSARFTAAIDLIDVVERPVRFDR